MRGIASLEADTNITQQEVVINATWPRDDDTLANLSFHLTPDEAEQHAKEVLDCVTLIRQRKE